jgi:hypothetical protein
MHVRRAFRRRPLALTLVVDDNLAMLRSDASRLGVLALLAAACGATERRDATTPTPDPAPTSNNAPTAPLPLPQPTAAASVEPTAAAEEPTGVVIARDVWLDAFKNALPVALCKDRSYFRSCFSVTAAECEQVSASATRVCIGNVRKQLPPKLHQPDEGTAWGRRIGGCVGTSYESTLAQHKLQSPKCDDPTAWPP